MIDWDAPDPEPDFVAPQNVVTVQTLPEALALIDQWISAYDELKREHVRLHLALQKAMTRADYYETLAKNEEAIAQFSASV